MSEKASSSQTIVAFGGSDALSHVYIQYPPLNCGILGSSGLFYDDGSKHLISPASDQVFSWKTSPFDASVAPHCDSLGEGPLLSIRFSLDEKLIAVQRSNTEIQCWNRETKETFWHKCKPESESILGFFWTDCPLCDVVIVKTSGLDLLVYDTASKSFRLVETRRLSVNWYVYTHESRLILLSSGMQCKTFYGFQLSSAGIIRLPRFDMTMAKSEANSKPVLDAEDVHLITIYGRIYCLQVDRVAKLLHLYRFYRDAVIQQGSLPIYSSKISVSVVDNVVLVHQIDAKVVILYDIFADSRAPISAPLPLKLRGFSRPNVSSRPFSEVGESLETAESNDHDISIYGDAWTFFVPDLVCDLSSRLLWKIHLDLEAVAASSSEVASILEFLQRRKMEANKAKQLCLGIVRTVILERRPLSMVARAIDVLVTAYSLSVKAANYGRGTRTIRASPSVVTGASSPAPGGDAPSTKADEPVKSIREGSTGGMYDQGPSTYSASDSEGSCSEATGSSQESQSANPRNNALNANVTEQTSSQLSSPAISPDELYKFVLAPIEEEMAAEPSYLVAIIVEFLCSINSEKLKVHPSLYVLMVRLLARSERKSELGLFTINKVIEPSKEVALQLLETGRQNPQTRKLGLDMLRQLSLHQDYISLLLQDGYYLEALRYARKHRVTSVRPSLFLEAAVASNDPQRLAAVLRFFSDFMPGFRSTADYDMYYSILSHRNSLVSA